MPMKSCRNSIASASAAAKSCLTMGVMPTATGFRRRRPTRITTAPAGPHGHGTWKVTLVVAGELTAPDAVITTTRPPDFRHQHLFDEQYLSKELLLPALKDRSGNPLRAANRGNVGRRCEGRLVIPGPASP